MCELSVLLPNLVTYKHINEALAHARLLSVQMCVITVLKQLENNWREHYKICTAAIKNNNAVQNLQS